jgi:hypothetical protein
MLVLVGYSVRLATGTPTNLAEAFGGGVQSLQANSGMLP